MSSRFSFFSPLSRSAAGFCLFDVLRGQPVNGSAFGAARPCRNLSRRQGQPRLLPMLGCSGDVSGRTFVRLRCARAGDGVAAGILGAVKRPVGRLDQAIGFNVRAVEGRDAGADRYNLVEVGIVAHSEATDGLANSI